MYKFLTLLLITIFLVACTPTATPEPNIPLTIEERINEETSPEEQEIPPTSEDLYGKRITENQSLIQKGVAVNLEGIYFNTSEKKMYFVITGEDRYETPEARNPLNWHATFYFTSTEHMNLFLCDFSQGEKNWTTTYCEEEKNIPENWYQQKTWIVYTLKEPNILTQRASILEIMREEDTFAFKTYVPKP